MGFSDFFQKIIKLAIFLTALTPLIAFKTSVYPFLLGKVLLFRTLTEFALFLTLIYFTYLAVKKDFYFFKKIAYFKHPLVILISVFFLSQILSSIFALNSYRAFWGHLERAEGIFGLTHFFILFLLMILFFKEKDWLRYFQLSLIVGAILIVYGIFEYFGIQKLPLSLPQNDRPMSLIGNSAFFATHLLFLILFAGLVFSRTCQAKRFSFWPIFSLVIGLASFLMIFLTQTRGAILGLFVGFGFLLIYFLFSKKTFFGFSISKISALLLIFAVIFSFVFLLTKSSLFWQKIPGLKRLAQINFYDLNDPTTQFRIITWKLSLNAFKERPFLGWGPENYIFAYQKYYDPSYAVYGESWLDRAHNKIFGVLVTQGIFGLLIYLALFGSLFYFSKKHPIFPLIAAFLIAYFVQNLFLFDQIISYLTIFSFLSYLVYFNLKNNQLVLKTEKIFSYIYPVFIGLATFLIFVWYFYVFIPFSQAKEIEKSRKITRASVLEKTIKEKIANPYNFAQFNIRSVVVDYYYDHQPHIFQNISFKPLAETLVDLINETIEKEPYDVRMFIRQARMWQYMGIYNPIYYQKAEKAMRTALKIAPNRQELYYHLAFALAGQNKFEQAIEIAKKAVELNQNVPRAHYHYAFILAVAGKKEKALQTLNQAKKLDPQLTRILAGDENIIAFIYKDLLNNQEALIGLIEEVAKNNIPKLRIDYYQWVLNYLAKKEDKRFIKIAEIMKKTYPQLKNDLDIFIDLAKKGNWKIILNYKSN